MAMFESSKNDKIDELYICKFDSLQILSFLIYSIHFHPMLIILLCILHKLHTLNRICIFIFIIYVRMIIFTMRNNILKIDQAPWDIRDTEYIILHSLLATSAIITMEW